VIKSFELLNVPQEQISQANLLSKVASSSKLGKYRSIIQETLKVSRVLIGEKEGEQVLVL